MAENMDSDPTNGTPSSPNGGSSEGSGDSGSSVALKLQSTIEALTKKLDEVDARSKSLQGDKDRGITKTQTEVADLKRKIAEIEKFKKAGLDEDSAFEELNFRDEVRSVREQLSKLNPTQLQPTGNSAGAVVDMAKAIKEYELDGNDPEVIASILSKNFASQVEAENAVLKLAIRRAKPDSQSISASPAMVGSPMRKDGNADLMNEYQKKISPLRGNVLAISQLQNEYRKKGLVL